MTLFSLPLFLHLCQTSAVPLPSVLPNLRMSAIKRQNIMNLQNRQALPELAYHTGPHRLVRNGRHDLQTIFETDADSRILVLESQQMRAFRLSIRHVS